MDLLGPFPLAPGQRKFLIVAVDYFTKWVEAEPLARIEESNVRSFVWRSVVCRFGLPRALVMDHGRQFDNARFKEFCDELKIEYQYASVAHPQCNGQAEVTNRTILQGLKARVDRASGRWAEELPSILWAYRTTSRATTGETPFSLAFWTEAVIPIELDLVTYRVDHFSEEDNDGALRMNLDFLEERREQAQIRAVAYQQRAARHYNSCVRERRFVIGDLVLRRQEVSDLKGHVGKLTPNWEGPYQVSGIVRPGTYRLATLEGEIFPRT